MTKYLAAAAAISTILSIITVCSTAQPFSVEAADFNTVWQQSNDLQRGVAFAYGFLLGSQTVLFGGTDDFYVDPATGNMSFIPTSEAFSGTHTKLWAPYPEANLPLPLWGYFACQNFVEDLFVTEMSTDQVFDTEPLGLVYTANMDTADVDGLVWTQSAPMAYSPINATVRRRAGFFALVDRVIFIGGIDVNKNFIPDIISYNLTSQEWSVEATIVVTKPSETLCDCQVQVLSACFAVAICGPCSQSKRRPLLTQVWYNSCTKNVSSPVSMPFSDPVISFDSTRVGHYVVAIIGQLGGGSIGLKNEDTSDSLPYTTTTGIPLSTTTAVTTEDSTTAPTTVSETSTSKIHTTQPPPPLTSYSPTDFTLTLLMLDLFNVGKMYASTNQYLRTRYGGTLYSEGSAIYYAGGFTDLTRTNFSTAVDTAEVLPSTFVSVSRSSRTYLVGEDVPFTTETYHAGMTVRLSMSPLCTHPVPSTGDTPVVQGVPGMGMGTISNITVPASNLYVCVSDGICNQNTSKSIPCNDGSENNNFQDCIMDRCCWVNGKCWQYEDGPDEDKFYMLASPTDPIHIILPTPSADGESAAARFFTSAGGIAFIVFSGAILLLLSLVIVWFVGRRRMESSGAYDENFDDEAHALEPSGGKYKVVRKLGQGGFGAVFLVTRRSDGKELALKHMMCPNSDERDYAIKEFQLLHHAQGHPNMIHLEEMLISWGAENISSINNDGDGSGSAVLQIMSTRDRESNKKSNKEKKPLDPEDIKNPLLPLLKASSRYVCIIMEYCEEGDLARLMLNNPKYRKGLPEKMVVTFAKQICSLLMHLHSRSPPIVHRDLKPENVLLKNNNTHVVLTDFGLAQQLEKSYMTTRAGTLHFIAPECWKKHYTSTVDMWSLGCIMWACCTGRVTNSTARVMFKDARGPAFEPEINHELRAYTPLLRRVVLGLLKIKTEHRLTAQQALDLLEQWKEDDTLKRRDDQEDHV